MDAAHGDASSQGLDPCRDPAISSMADGGTQRPVATWQGPVFTPLNLASVFNTTRKRTKPLFWPSIFFFYPQFLGFFLVCIIALANKFPKQV
jgi:hypothetical protein